MNEADLRVIKTKQNIHAAFLRLLKERGSRSITVSSLSGEAQINRKTFYSHYETVDALYDEVCEDCLSLLDASEILSPSGTGSTSIFIPDAIEVLRRIAAHKERFLLLMNDSSGPPRFSGYLKQYFLRIASQDFRLSQYAEEHQLPASLVMEIFSDIFLEITLWWIAQDRVSAEKAAEVLVSLFSESLLSALSLEIWHDKT